MGSPGKMDWRGQVTDKVNDGEKRRERTKGKKEKKKRHKTQDTKKEDGLASDYCSPSRQYLLDRVNIEEKREAAAVHVVASSRLRAPSIHACHPVCQPTPPLSPYSTPCYALRFPFKRDASWGVTVWRLGMYGVHGGQSMEKWGLEDWRTEDGLQYSSGMRNTEPEGREGGGCVTCVCALTRNDDGWKKAYCWERQVPPHGKVTELQSYRTAELQNRRTAEPQKLQKLQKLQNQNIGCQATPSWLVEMACHSPSGTSRRNDVISGRWAQRKNKAFFGEDPPSLSLSFASHFPKRADRQNPKRTKTDQNELCQLAPSKPNKSCPLLWSPCLFSLFPFSSSSSFRFDSSLRARYSCIPMSSAAISFFLLLFNCLGIVLFR